MTSFSSFRISFAPRLCILGALLFALLACNGVKKQMKEASLLEESGLKMEALTRYTAIHKETGKAEAMVARRRLAQGMLDDLSLRARSKCGMGNYEEALNTYQEARSFSMTYRDLELKLPAGFESSVNDCKRDYIDAIYQEAEQLALDARYDEAKRRIQKIYSLDRDNKKAQYLENLCDILPNYTLGEKAYEQGMYREAFEYFDRVVKLDAGYKNALALRNECLAKSTFTLAYIPLKGKKDDCGLAATLAGEIKEEILALKSPFIKLIEREQLDAVVSEQSFNMGALVDNQSAIQAGKLLGARYILTGETVNFKVSDDVLSSQEQRGFIGSSVNGKKIKYTTFEGVRSIEGNFRFQLLDAETGQIYVSENFPIDQTFRESWALFNGSEGTSDLYPGDWKFGLITSKADFVDIDGKEKLDQMFANNDRSRWNHWNSKVMNNIGRKVAESLRDFRP